MIHPQKLSALSTEQLSKELAHGGVSLRVPPFVMHITSPIPVVAEGLMALYGQHELIRDPAAFTDFPVSVTSEWRFFKRVCVFAMDGFQPFTPLAYGEAYAFLEWGMNWCITSHGHSWLTIHSAVLEKNGGGDQYIRPVAFRGSEMMAVSAQHNKIHVAIATWNWPSMSWVRSASASAASLRCTGSSKTARALLNAKAWARPMKPVPIKPIPSSRIAVVLWIIVFRKAINGIKIL